MPEKAEMSFVQACSDFFGRKPDQGLREFMLEVKQLNEKDRKEIADGLIKLGYTIKDMQ